MTAPLIDMWAMIAFLLESDLSLALVIMRRFPPLPTCVVNDERHGDPLSHLATGRFRVDVSACLAGYPLSPVLAETMGTVGPGLGVCRSVDEIAAGFRRIHRGVLRAGVGRRCLDDDQL